MRYLESEALGTKFHFELHESDQLLQAAKKLRIIGLQRLCERAVGEYRLSIRDKIPWAEVKQRNAEGELLLVSDGNVCNVTDWLDLHPGGNTIIPEQALNCDATVLFEVYHASHDSFIFLKQLYIGRLDPSDLDKVPPPKAHSFSHTKASESFLKQLRNYMGVHFKLFHSF